MRTRFVLLLLLAIVPGCAFHSVATHWNGRVGPDGRPVYVRTITNLGLNIGVVLPVLGSTSIDEMIDEATESIAEKGSDRVRVIETTSNNYWDGLPPVTWLVTPVVTTIGVEYQPSDAEIEAVAAEHASAAERARIEREQDHSHIIPEPRRDG